MNTIWPSNSIPGWFFFFFFLPWRKSLGCSLQHHLEGLILEIMQTSIDMGINKMWLRPQWDIAHEWNLLD